MCTLKLPAAELRRGEEVPDGPEPMRASVGLLVSGVPHHRRASPAGIAFMKCDACGRRPTMVWDPRYKEPYASAHGFRAIWDFFTSPELRRRKFQCAHCKREFLLSGYQAPNHGMQPMR